MHSLEIIKLQFEKERQTFLCILELLTNIVHELNFEKCVVTPNFLSCIIINRGKNTFELVGTVLK